MDEWDKLASWIVDNKLFSHNVRWLVQIPRLYNVYHTTNVVKTFNDIIKSTPPMPCRTNTRFIPTVV